MTIAVYGGSFNPPTKAHEAVIQSCLNQSWLDEVWVMPSGNRLDKQYSPSGSDRIRMLELMHEEVFNKDDKVKISKIEIDRLPMPTQTWRTVEALKRTYTGYKFWFVFGADSLQDMPAWDKGKELRRCLNMLVVPRASIYVPSEPNIRILPVKLPAVSSTEVRQRTKNKEPISGLVSEGVRQYITKTKLYQD